MALVNVGQWFVRSFIAALETVTAERDGVSIASGPSWLTRGRTSSYTMIVHLRPRPQPAQVAARAEAVCDEIKAIVAETPAGRVLVRLGDVTVSPDIPPNGVVGGYAVRSRIEIVTEMDGPAMPASRRVCAHRHTPAPQRVRQRRSPVKT